MTATHTSGTTDVLDALARFRAADAQMHQRVRANAALGENELRILQYVLACDRDGLDVKPSEISRHLGISSASTTALLDRLERLGSVQRVNHPTDRRSILIAPTERAAAEVADLVDAFENRVAAAIRRLDPSGRAAVLSFLDAATGAADEIAGSVVSRDYASM
ncbi:MarR family transcriptional regulator [Microbacterium hominis]|uniref:MarR family winged helix-turn-helix transcriptional regulator n=1 Tax=Microbacterium hominis TaxID=162426 RepID=UPI001962C423|nr:MarR family transcriptional regulator [Microbacterium hominis]QRY40008.1 MarR family transcriptional regulator [Microbacterium hominis]